MDFSPIVIQRKYAAPVEGSTNPFDDFDILFEADHLGANASALRDEFSSLVSNQNDAYRRAADSEDDVFGLFSDGESKSNSRSPSKKSSLRKEIDLSCSGSESDDVESSKESGDLATTAAPPIPPRIEVPQKWAQRMKEPVIPLHTDDAQLYAFVISPLEVGCALKMTIKIDSLAKCFNLIHDATNKVILTASKRTDGLKALALTSNISILLMPTDRSVAASSQIQVSSVAGSMTEPVRIAKIRSNALGSQYSMFDCGKSPSKANGVIDMRRELMSVKFELVSGIYSRRAAWCCLPRPNAVRRPTCKDETLQERAKKADRSVLALSPMVPMTNRLPKVEDFGGFVDVHSIKNMILHDPDTKQVTFRLGRTDSTRFEIEFCHPFSVASAFALALSSIDSKVHPSRQI